MWYCRRMLKVLTTEYRTNFRKDNQELDIEQYLFVLVQIRILKFFGHVSRRDNGSIERLDAQGSRRYKTASKVSRAMNRSIKICSRLSFAWVHHNTYKNDIPSWVETHQLLKNTLYVDHDHSVKCTTNETKLYSWMTNGISVICNHGNWKYPKTLTRLKKLVYVK